MSLPAISDRLRFLRSRVRYDPDTVYDLNLAVLTHCWNGDRTRIHCLKRYGVVNSAELKVHVCVIGSPGDFDHCEEICNDWIINADVSMIEMPTRHPIPKINGYYLWLKESKLMARWHARIDDDSLTDVALALNYLDGRFGDASVHVATSPLVRNEHRAVFVPYLLERGEFLPSVDNESESSFTSSQGMREIFDHEIAMSMIIETGNNLNAPGDRALAIAAHLARVPVAESPRSQWRFFPERFSLFGGDLYHIHYVPWENREMVRIIAAFVAEVDESIDERSLAELIGHPLCIHAGRTKAALLTMCADGSVVGGEEFSISMWELGMGKLRLMSNVGILLASFERCGRVGQELVIRGFATEDEPRLVIRKMYLPNRRSPESVNNRPTALHRIGEDFYQHKNYYMRLGYDSCMISCLPDGCIVEGYGPRERCWSMRQENDRTILEILGDNGITCELQLGCDGIWRGRYMVAEPMSVAIIPMDLPLRVNAAK